MLRVILLIMRLHAMWPDAPLVDLIAATRSAVAVESPIISAELLLSIAQHESDFKANAVSWRADGRTVSILWNGKSAVPRKIVCGFIQAMGTPETCRREIDRDGVMRAGVEELREWATTCHGDVACIVRGHAGGTQCAVTGACSSKARAFSALFIENARRLTR